MKLQLFIIGGLAIHLYYSPESEINKNTLILDELIVFIPGLPQYIDKRFFSDKVTKNRAFMSVYYYGTWLSGKEFTPHACTQTVIDAVKFANGKEGESTFDGQKILWNFKKMKLIGNSFAGNPIITALQNYMKLDEVDLYNPLIYLNKEDIKKLPNFNEELFSKQNKQFLFFMRKGYLNTIRGIDSNAWDDYFSGFTEHTKVNNLPENLTIKVYQGCKDLTINPEWTKYFCHSQSEKCQFFPVEGMGHDFINMFNFVNK